MIIGVTGSSGKLGRAAVSGLRADGHQVVGFDVAGRVGSDFTRVDLGDFGQTLDATLSVTARHRGLDAIVHLAAIHTAPPALPLDETFTRANNTYGLGKVAEEAIAAQLAHWGDRVSITALRFTNVVAEDEYSTFERAADPSYRRDLMGTWIDARDGASAIALALEHATPGYRVYNVAAPTSGSRIPSRELAALWFPGTPVAHDLGEFESLVSVRKIVRELGFEARHDWR